MNIFISIVAIKIYDRLKLANQDKEKYIKQEISILNKLKHNNIIRILNSI